MMFTEFILAKLVLKVNHTREMFKVKLPTDYGKSSKYYNYYINLNLLCSLYFNKCQFVTYYQYY